MIKYSKIIWLLERCGKKMYITTDVEIVQNRINEAFDAEYFAEGQTITLRKCNDGCCYNISHINILEEENILNTHTALRNSNGDYYNDETLSEAFDIYPEYSLLEVYINVVKKDGECDCTSEKFYYFKDVCSQNIYAIDVVNYESVENRNINVNPNLLYELWIGDEQRQQTVKHICEYVETAQNPEIVLLTRKRLRSDIPIEKFDCGGAFVFERCGTSDLSYFLFVDGIEISELIPNKYYSAVDENGVNVCYRYVRRENNEAELVLHITSGSYSDCGCKKGSILFRTCDGTHTIECTGWLSTSVYDVDSYYSVATGFYAPVLNFDGYLYRNCLEYLGYSEDNPEIEPDYTGLNITKSKSCEHDDCTVYFETSVKSCLDDYESVVYVTGDLMNYMRENDYNSFMWNGKNCLTLPFVLDYVSQRSDDIPTIDVEDVDAFFKDCDECLDTLDISCYVIHPCDGSRDIYIEKQQQGAMCEPVDLSIYENRYISFNYFGKIKCGFVEHYCKELTEGDRRISSNNIIECYYSCAECYDNEEAKQNENNKQETKQKVGREIEPNYTANGEYCNKKHKHCCCDDH